MCSYINKCDSGCQVINSIMKIIEIINESREANTRYDLILHQAMANPYGAGGTELDAHYNPEIVANIKYELDRYKKLGDNPVFLKPEKQKGDKYSNEPKKGDIQSAGYRGKEKALQRSGIRKAKPLVYPQNNSNPRTI